jgi:hypothetical protein
MVSIHHGILLSQKENEIMPFIGKWMELENIILSEIIQANRAIIGCSFSCVKSSDDDNFTGT